MHRFWSSIVVVVIVLLVFSLGVHGASVNPASGIEVAYLLVGSTL